MSFSIQARGTTRTKALAQIEAALQERGEGPLVSGARDAVHASLRALAADAPADKHVLIKLDADFLTEGGAVTSAAFKVLARYVPAE